jgi:cytidylate kinase
MIVTIDGPAGAGKSSAARLLAQRLSFDFLDTGAMYRAVALAALRAGVAPSSETELARLVDGLDLQMPPGHVIMNGEDVSTLIRTPEVTAITGKVADSPAVRKRLAAAQRAIATNRMIVCEGRDQGTIVFPHAECKFFLVADPAERARRRHREMTARGSTMSLDQVLESQKVRDAHDECRDIAPMEPADDAIRLDSTGLSLEDVVSRMEAEVRRRMGAVS